MHAPGPEAAAANNAIVDDLGGHGEGRPGVVVRGPAASPLKRDELRSTEVQLKLGFTHKETHEAVALLQSKMEVVEPASLDQPVCRDPDDDVVLATALGGECDCIVTGDKDLLVLERFRQIPILAPASFWRHEKF